MRGGVITRRRWDTTAQVVRDRPHVVSGVTMYWGWYMRFRRWGSGKREADALTRESRKISLEEAYST
jgi:hypothetical protein